MNLVGPRKWVDLDHLGAHQDGDTVPCEAAQHAVEWRHEDGVANLGNGLAPMN